MINDLRTLKADFECLFQRSDDITQSFYIEAMDNAKNIPDLQETRDFIQQAFNAIYRAAEFIEEVEENETTLQLHDGFVEFKINLDRAMEKLELSLKNIDGE